MTSCREDLAIVLGVALDPSEEPWGKLIERVRDLAAENERLRDLVSRSWTIVHKRARVVLPGDLVANESGKTWHVDDVATDAFETTIVLARSGRPSITRTTARDAAVPVLMPIPTRDGVVLLRELGAQLVPLQDDAADDGDPVEADPDRHGQVHTGACGAHPHVSLPGCTPG